MFKKISIVFCAFLFVVLLGQVKVSAANYDNVKDNLDYLTSSEEANLKEEIDMIAKDLHLEAVIVITKDTEGKSSRDFADDYYDNNGFGAGSDYSGLLMLVNMDKREVWISTYGKAIDIFTDIRISGIIKNVTSSLSDARYYDACNTFLKDIRKYENMGIPAGQYREDADTTVETAPKTYFQKVFQMIKTFYIYIGALAISVIATVIASLSSKGKVTINSQTYEEQGSFVLNGTNDDYIRENTTRTKIEKNSGGGKSSTHRSSSGRSHGGGGGSF